MKRTIKVGIIQQTCTNDIRHNLSKLHHNIEQVAAAGAQLVVLQELHNTPYFCQTEDTDMFDLAFYSGHYTAVGFPSRFYYGSTPSDAVRCVLRIYAERETLWQFVQFPERDVCRHAGLVQRFGTKGTEQFYDLRIPKKEITHGK